MLLDSRFHHKSELEDDAAVSEGRSSKVTERLKEEAKDIGFLELKARYDAVTKLLVEEVEARVLIFTGLDDTCRSAIEDIPARDA